MEKKGEEKEQVKLENGDIKQEQESTIKLEDCGPGVDMPEDEINKSESDVVVENKIDTSKVKNEDIKSENIEVKEENVQKPDEQVKTEIPEVKVEKKETEGTENEQEPVSESLVAMQERIKSPKPAVEPTLSKSSTNWHVVCATLDDWINLAEWFKDSSVRCEKSLAKVIREDFLPVLPEIIEARVSTGLGCFFLYTQQTEVCSRYIGVTIL